MKYLFLPHTLLTSLASLLLAVGPLQAGTVVNDPFSDGGKSNGADAQDIAWYGLREPATAFAVVADTGSPGIGTGNALRFTPATGTIRKGMTGALAKPVTLEDGESIRLTFNFRFTGTLNLNYSGRLRFGIYNSGGTPISEDGTTRTFLYWNDEGYFCGLHGNSSSTTATGLAREKGAGDEITWGGGIDGAPVSTTALSLVPGASTPLGTNPHTGTMTIKRVGTSLQVSAQLDSLTPATLTDVWPVAFHFDQIAISFGQESAPSPILIDNVRVEHLIAGLSDGLTDGSATDNTSDGDDTAWYTMAVASTALTVVNDSTLASGNAIKFTSTAQSQGIVGRLASPITLANGGSLSLTFRYRFESNPTSLNNPGRLRFGLYNAGGTFTSSHNQGTVRNNDVGYYGQTNPASTSGTTSIARETSGNELLGATGVTTIGSTGASASNPTAAHTAVLRITRNGSTLVFSSSIDGLAAATATDASPLTYTFDEVAFGIGTPGVTAPLILDNIKVSTAPAFPVGDGTYDNPVAGPSPAHNIGGTGFRLVKNWDFGVNGNIRSINEMSAHFRYYDPQNQINTGAGEYGANTVAPHPLTARDANAPVEGPATNNQVVRQMMTDWLRGFVVPFAGVTVLDPHAHNCGGASFYTKWRLPAGGSRLGRELIWETQVRYVTPPYFWTALWTTATIWQNGAEMDLMESFGTISSNGAYNNSTGKYWHSNVIGGTDNVNYTNWDQAMAGLGITNYDATQPHTWTWHYKADNTYVAYVDGIAVQWGTVQWTTGGTSTGTPMDLSFLFDAGWGHTQVDGLRDKTLPVSQLAGKYYEWNYTRVYLK